MWEWLANRVPSGSVLCNALLAALIPWCVFQINRTLHRHGDPPWKKE